MMDFPGGAITNISVIDGFSNIYWRIYSEEPSSVPSSPDVPTNGYNILKHLSRLKDLEIKLRNLDCLVSCYPRRLGLWIFSATPGFESLSSLSQEPPNESNKLLVGSTSLKVSASGSTTAQDLLRTLSADPQAPSAGPSGPQKPQSGGANASRSGDSYGNAAAIYASFVSAVAGAINLQLIRRHNAIPLGSRTLFTAVDRSNYDSPTIANDDVDSFPALTSIRIELSQVGKVIVSLHTVCQNGITRLVGSSNTADRWDIQPNTDVWLAPNGTVARVLSANTDHSTTLTPKQQNMRATNDGALNQATEAKQRLWKATVLEWIANVGLPVNTVEEEPWVEVEVSEPFYTRLASDYWRQVDPSQSSNPLKRIAWPARYCFKRTRAASSTYFEGVNSPIKDSDDPLQFAEDWLAEAGSRNEKLASRSSALSQAQQNKDMSTPKTDIPDNIESLARIAQYPDLQAASLVYPTPPDGALVQGMIHIGSDMFGTEGSDLAASQTPGERLPVKREEQTSDVIVSGFGPSNGLGVGSGMYDTNDDEDLFGEMNEKDFGSKGISDADFSFFDEPDFGSLDNDRAKGDTQEHQQTSSLSQVPEAKAAPEDIPAEKSLESQGISVEPAETDIGAVAAPKSNLTVDTSVKAPSGPQETLPEDRPPSRSRQTISPPLSPVEIKKILFSNPQSGQPGRGEGSGNPTIDKNARRQSNYDPVAFQQDLAMSDRKYGANGRFFFSEKTNAATAATREDTQIPTVGFPRGQKSRSENHIDHRATGSQQQTPIHSTQPRLRSPSVSSDETTDDTSDDISQRAASPTRFTGLKRKRPASQADNSTTSSSEGLSTAPDVDVTTSKEENSVFLGNFLSAFSDWSLAGYFSTRQNQFSPVLLRKEDQIQLAQLMVDQVTQSSLCHKVDGCMGLPDLEHDALSLRTFLEDTTIMGDIERLDLKTYVSLQDSSHIAANESSRQNTQRKDIKGSITKLPPPHLRIHRGRDFLEVLPPAISFWETFGFEPANGTKNISAYCIYPQNAKEGADAFLDRLGFLYSSCNLGKHVRGDRSKTFENGLGAWHVTLGGNSGYLSTMQSLRTLCEGLGTALSKAPPVRDNFVIYIINPFTHGAALADICSAFLQLFQKYVGDVDRHQARQQLNELVLQVVPMSFISSPSSLVVPTQTEYLNLALEVYNRCPPKDTSSGVMGCAPPVLLAESVPKSINFRLAPERTSPFQEGKCLHLALSRSLDQRWISAAWSDGSGSCQVTLSYCLRTRGSSISRMVSDVRHEIWETTKDIMERTQTRWKIFLVRTEPTDQEDIDAWTGLVERYNQMRSMPVELTILSVNIAPGLRLELPSSQIQLNTMNSQTSSTPVTTPHAGMPSPDQFGGSAATPTSSSQGPANAPTPTDISSIMEPESDAVLIDAADESWGIILSHRLSNSLFMTEYRPALASGYLLRRKGVSESQGVVAMGVNLVYTQRPPASYETVLRETLGMYRDLATLARAKGTLHVQRNTLPWHIATAVKGQELLSYIL